MTTAKPIDIYKITSDPLPDAEAQLGCQQITPIAGPKLTANAYFEKILGNFHETGELLSPSELGCALSHISVYQRIMETGRAAIILESDITPSANQLSLAMAFCRETTLDFVHLGWHPQVSYGVYFIGLFDKKNQAYRIEPSRNFYGAFAYYITPVAAAELLDFHQATLRKADYWSAFFEGAETPPYFRPFFEHPVERGELDRQRKSAFVKTKRMTARRVATAVRSRLRTLVRTTFGGYRPIQHGDVPQSLE
jgi:glycosyl transferase family 25